MVHEPKDVRDLLNALDMKNTRIDYHEILQSEMADEGCERWPLFKNQINNQLLLDMDAKTL